ncbi:uncharacterized protein ARMOST_02727 [Armillaria ostoyae]|uniref:Uncharacterized protein n=1 Tax=Armillaria ostoyae TaxID=47428 RepID=A0A284QSI2_ARMOS|nr:uncharacterized protein ARMOST_02727 [Armillaria ostoyae]
MAFTGDQPARQTLAKDTSLAEE